MEMEDAALLQGAIVQAEKAGVGAVLLEAASSRLVEVEEVLRVRAEEEERLRGEAAEAARKLAAAEDRLRKAADAGDDEAELSAALEQAADVGVSSHLMWMSQTALGKLRDARIEAEEAREGCGGGRGGLVLELARLPLACGARGMPRGVCPSLL
eukprot:1537673-Prymnesium_polylepis.1